MFAHWAMSGPGDLHEDGIVDAADAGILFAHWTADVPPREPTVAAAAIPRPWPMRQRVWIFVYRLSRKRGREVTSNVC